VTIPIIDTSAAHLPNPVTIVGYLQAFVDGVEPGFVGPNPNDVAITVMNIVGCANSNALSANTPVIGATGSTTIPIRLITKP